MRRCLGARGEKGGRLLVFTARSQHEDKAPALLHRTPHTAEPQADTAVAQSILRAYACKSAHHQLQYAAIKTEPEPWSAIMQQGITALETVDRMADAEFLENGESYQLANHHVEASVGTGSCEMPRRHEHG